MVMYEIENSKPLVGSGLEWIMADVDTSWTVDVK